MIQCQTDWPDGSMTDRLKVSLAGWSGWLNQWFTLESIDSQTGKLEDRLKWLTGRWNVSMVGSLTIWLKSMTGRLVNSLKDIQTVKKKQIYWLTDWLGCQLDDQQILTASSEKFEAAVVSNPHWRIRSQSYRVVTTLVQIWKFNWCCIISHRKAPNVCVALSNDCVISGDSLVG